MTKKLHPAISPGSAKLIFFFFFFSFILDQSSAQTVAGKVSDATGKGIPNVSVTVKGDNKGTSTDPDGLYSIGAGPKATLVFSSVGFITMDIAVSGRQTVNAVLTAANKDLEDVIVTALGIKRESKKIGYSATSVNTEELVKNRTTNVGESLEGRVAGLNITPPAAGAGASNQIRLRGQVGFAGADNSPLLVINGIPMDQGAQSADGGGQMRDRGDNLANINPDDIESMTVLKGATAAALYGSRAARGAIIITTKSGQKNQGIGVDFNSSYTTSQALNFFDEIRQTQYGQGQGGVKFTTQGQVQGNGQFGWGAKLDGLPTINFDGAMRPYTAHPNNLTDFLQTGTNITNTIGLSGGGSKGSFRASISNTDAKGIAPTNEYKRTIFNLGLNHNVTDKLKLQMNINYADEQYINPPQIGTQGDGIVNFFNRTPVSIPLEAYRDNAFDPVTGGEYKTNGFLGTVNNPYVPIKSGQKYKEERNRLLGTTTLRYDITKWLYAQGRFSLDRYNNFVENNLSNATGAAVLTNADGTYRGSYNINRTWTTDINADFLVGGNHKFRKISVDASFGGNTLRSKFQNISETATNFTVANLYTISNGTVKTANPLGFAESRINSLYGLAEIGYNDLLYVNLTGRNDWFSVLNPANNSKFYPSVSGSFIFSELLPNVNWLSYGKLRTSWAKVGSVAGVGAYDGALTYGINGTLFNGQTLAGVANVNTVALAPNPSLQPFTVTEKEIGLEVKLFKNRLLLDVAAFDKVTTEQIIDVNLSTASGYSASKQNEASLKNSGLETLVEYKAIQGKNFNWSTSLNNTYLKTEVLEVGTPSGTRLLLYFNGTGNEFLGEIRYTEGMAMNQLYVKRAKRNAKGEIVVGANGRLIEDKTSGPIGTGFYPVGSAIPDFTGGWNNNFSYKNLSVGVFIDYKFGGTVLSSTLLNMTRQGLSTLSLEGRETGIIVPGVYNDGLPNAGQPNTTVITAAGNGLQSYWSDYRNYQIGEPFTFKSDFIKLRSISLAYNFTSLLKNTAALKFVKGLSLSASVRNLAIIYKDIPGLDPEAIQSSGDIRAGYENSALPTTRNYNLTLNVKF
ncbi:MAG: SusC/RagA family TonB-linked outer membrane protein [Chitinophagaceae bacterium]|nr:MAG: SusC/RagA family TonB-linked outer membrane protein [Chitinophagaceae bacterium]